ncbi:MAG: hypothetical protein AAGE52_09885 [Myxococcota bacterium]
MVRLTLLAALLVACGSSSAAPPVVTLEPVTIEGWPALPWPPAGIGFRALLDLHRQLDELPAAEGVAWARDVHAPWIERRAELLAHAGEARRELRRGPAQEIPLGAAIHGALLSRTADQLEDVDLRALPPEAAAAVRAPVVDLRQRASAAFQVCADELHSPELDAWRRACLTRQRALSAGLPRDP